MQMGCVVLRRRCVLSDVGCVKRGWVHADLCRMHVAGLGFLRRLWGACIGELVARRRV
jgi:hypothetical protein